MSSMSDTCFLGPWEQKRNFSWSAIDQVNLNGYVSHLSRTHCIHMYPGAPEPSEDEDYAYPEPRVVKSGASIKSASSSSYSSRNQSDKDINESNQTKRTAKLKKKPQSSDMASLKNPKGSTANNTRVQSGLRNRKGSNSMSSMHKLDQINNRIDMQLNQLRSNQRTYEVSGAEAKRDNDQSNHNQNKSDTIFGDNLTNYNPSTLYRLKKLQNSDQLNRRQFHSNLIATLDTNCDSARVFDRGTAKKCPCCTKDQVPRSDFVNNLVNKSSSDYCTCSDVDSESSEEIIVNRKHQPSIQRVKSVVCLRNKNIEFVNHAMHPLHVQGTNTSSSKDTAANKVDSKQNSILKINKCNNESKLVALKQFCSASIGMNRAKNKVKQAGSNPNINSSPTGQSEMPTTTSHESSGDSSRQRQRARQNSLVKNNNIELELSPDFDNSHSSSARSKIAATPNTPNTPSRNASCYSRQKLPPANNATFYGSSINNARMHIQNLHSKYPETIAINGKSFITNANVANLDFQISNTLQPAKKVISNSNHKRITSAETEIRDIQIKFNQLTKIGVK